LLTYPEALM